jgi:uncharacterized membrane protein
MKVLALILGLFVLISLIIIIIIISASLKDSKQNEDINISYFDYEEDELKN